MAIRTVAQAAADIRLSDAKANADFERIRRALVQKATRLEADMAIAVPVTLDQQSLQGAAAGLSQLQQDIEPIVVPADIDHDALEEGVAGIAAEPVVVPVTVDTDQALADLSALSQLGVVIPVSVSIDTDQALADLIALSELDIVVAVKVSLDTDQALEDLAALADLADEISVPVIADVETAAGDIAGLVNTGDDVVRLGVTVDTDEATRQLQDLAATETVIDVPVHIETEGALGQINSLGSNQLLGLTVPVRANTAEVTRAITQVTTLAKGPFTVEFQANVADVRGQVSALGTLIPGGLEVPVDANTAPLVASVATAGDSLPPIKATVLPDTDGFKEAVARTELPPLLVPVTAAQAGPGGSKVAFARLGAELEAVKAEIAASPPAVMKVVSTADQVGQQIAGISKADYEAVINVVGNTDSLQSTLAASTGLVDEPVIVPVTVDGESATASARQAGEQVGEAFRPGAERGGEVAGSAFGRSLLTTANRVLSVGALALGGLLASSLVEGFQRFTTIQDSTASLTVALQSTTKAAELLGDVLNVVRGTPFRLDDFARAATNMVSFGIEAKKVPLYLTAIGEAAATRGSQANQFAQSLATIFGQVQAIGKINGEDIWQFGNVGVDALRILGNTVGVTTAEIRKMISEGAIPAEFALDALAQGILNGTEGINGATVAFSGTMEALGDTLSGSIENFGAAKARFGVAIIDPISDTLIEGFQSFTKVIDGLTEHLKVSLAGIENTPVFEGINDFFEKAPSLINPTIDALEKLGPALAPIGIAFGALGLGALGTALGPLGALIPGVTGIGGALTVAAGAAALLTPEIRNSLIPTLQELGDVGLEVGGSIVRGLSDALEAVAPTVARGLDVIRESVPDLRGLFATALSGIGEIGPDVQPILEHLVDFLDQALPIAIRATSQAIVFVTAAVDAALPVVDRLIEAGIDLLPVASSFLDVAQVVGEVLIPVLGTLGELLGDLPVGVLETMLGIFLGFKAIGFVSGVVNGIAVGFERVGTSVGKVARAGPIAQTAGVAVGGAFSGMALASEDAATRITGAIGSISTVMLGFATGGTAGGLIAAAAVGIGFITQGFIDSKQEAERLEEAVGHLADRIRSEFSDELVTPEGIIDTKAFEGIVLEGLGTDALLKLKTEAHVGMEEIRDAAQTDAELVQRALRLGMDPKGITFFEDWVDDQIGALVRLKTEAEGFDFDESLNRRLAGIDFSGLNESEFRLASKQWAKEFGLDAEDVRSQMHATIDVQEELGDDFRTTVQTIGGGIEEVIVGQSLLGDTAEETGDKVTAVGEETEDAADRAARALADFKESLLEDGITFEELQDQAQELGDEAVTAADRASAAFEAFGAVLDSIAGKLDMRVATQNLDQDFRDITGALTDIINEDDIKRADSLNENIDDSNDRILNLKEQLARAVEDGNEKLAAFDGDIAQAEALGLTNRAAELRERRARVAREVADDQGDIQDRIDEELDKLRELRAEVAQLSTVPTTLMQQLVAQAAEANMSFFDFLLAAPTPEAQQFFQDNIKGTIDDALARATDLGLTDPLGGQRLAEQFLAPFRQSLIDGGIPADVVDALIAEVWPADKIKLGAQTAAEAALQKFNEEIEAAEALDPNSVELDVEIGDLQKQRDDLEAFAKDHPELKIDIAPVDEALVDLRMKEHQAAIDARIALVTQANAVQFLEGFGGPAAVAAAFPTDQQVAERTARKILKAAQDVFDKPGNSLEMHAAIADVEGTKDEFEDALALTPNVKLPADIDIEAINLVLDEDKKAAFVKQVMDLFPEIFPPTTVQPEVTAGGLVATSVGTLTDIVVKAVEGGGGTVGRMRLAEGGIVGYRDAPHMPQIAYGDRMWAEPETGGEAYLPLAMGKRVSALGVFMKVAEIFDLDVRQRRDRDREEREQVPLVMVPSSLPPAVERTFTDPDDVRIVTPDVNVAAPGVSFTPTINVVPPDGGQPPRGGGTLFEPTIHIAPALFEPPITHVHIDAGGTLLYSVGSGTPVMTAMVSTRAERERMTDIRSAMALDTQRHQTASEIHDRVVTALSGETLTDRRYTTSRDRMSEIQSAITLDKSTGTTMTLTVPSEMLTDRRYSASEIRERLTDRRVHILEPGETLTDRLVRTLETEDRVEIRERLIDTLLSTPSQHSQTIDRHDTASEIRDRLVQTLLSGDRSEIRDRLVHMVEGGLTDRRSSDRTEISDRLHTFQGGDTRTTDRRYTTSEILDRLVQTMESTDRTQIFTPGPEHTNLFAAPEVTLPEVAQMFRALDRGADEGRLDKATIRQAMIEALQATRSPLTQEQYDKRVNVEKVFLGHERNGRRQAFEFFDEMRRLNR